MKKIYEDMKKIFESKISTKILAAIGILIILMLVFSAGIFVGFHKASFGQAWGDNYERNFGTMPPRYGFDFGQDNFPNANGAIGKIIKIQLPTIIVQDNKDNTEKVVLIKDDTQIQKMMISVKASGLSVDDFVVVIGDPNNQGQIEAKFIRIMPLGMPVPPMGAPTPLK
jgi:hypothetical protein